MLEMLPRRAPGGNTSRPKSDRKLGSIGLSENVAEEKTTYTFDGKRTATTGFMV